LIFEYVIVLLICCSWGIKVQNHAPQESRKIHVVKKDLNLAMVLEKYVVLCYDGMSVSCKQKQKIKTNTGIVPGCSSMVQFKMYCATDELHGV
jgi:hypothetical protein